jgi:putative glutamine amidotransferase
MLPPVISVEDLSPLLNHLDGLLLSGGEDLAPERYGQERGPHLGRVDEIRDAGELALLRAWLSHGKPLFAICRGHQILNVALNGTLYQDIAESLPNALDHAFVPARPMERTVHTVDLQPNSRLARILEETTVPVNSAHHQAVAEVGRDLVVTALAPDGVIEGLELPDHRFCLGVQWHPEAMVKVSDSMWSLFEAFVEAAST